MKRVQSNIDKIKDHRFLFSFDVTFFKHIFKNNIIYSFVSFSIKINS